MRVDRWKDGVLAGKEVAEFGRFERQHFSHTEKEINRKSRDDRSREKEVFEDRIRRKQGVRL
jgi:hypothetical protein